MRTLSLEPLTRVEGHGRVDLVLGERGLEEVRVALTESPRLFEGLVMSRSCREVPALVCRICSICSGVHRVAAAQALEQALQVEIPPAARRVRELLLLGGHIESHALHLFCLVLPDLRQRPGLLDLVRDGDPVARDGLELKALGNRIQELAGGRVIHPVNVELGGVLRLPARDQLLDLQAELASWEARLADLTASFAGAAAYPASAGAAGVRIAVAGTGPLTLQGETLALSDGRRLPAAAYRTLLAEQSVSHSNAKQSRDGAATFLAGALARSELTNAGGPLASEDCGIFANNAAQARELKWALERCGQLLEELLACPADVPLQVPVLLRAGAGTVALEAPRGLLIHHYLLDDAGRVVEADIVTPTAINQATMEVQLGRDLAGVADEAQLQEQAGQIVRAFDPCISCAVHVLRR